MQASSRSRSADERAHVQGGALALGAADRHLERGDLVVADAPEAGEAGLAQLPAAAAVLVGADLDAGKGVLERADHALAVRWSAPNSAAISASETPECRAAAISARRMRSGPWRATRIGSIPGRRRRQEFRDQRSNDKNSCYDRAFQDDIHPVYDLDTSTVQFTCRVRHDA